MEIHSCTETYFMNNVTYLQEIIKAKKLLTRLIKYIYLWGCIFEFDINLHKMGKSRCILNLNFKEKFSLFTITVYLN